MCALVDLNTCCAFITAETKIFRMVDFDITLPSLPRHNEKRLHGLVKDAIHFVIGVDEAGRGPLAGPVVAAAFAILSTGKSLPPTPKSLSAGVTDSKQLSEPARELVFHQRIQGNSLVKYQCSVVDNRKIDKINILQATFEAMTESALKLISDIKHTHPGACFSILIDGNKIPPKLKDSGHHTEFLIKGDSIEFVIAAASICAKVERDRIMYELDKQFPMYGFGQHKGYPTGSHVAAIKAHGPCKFHRMTFAPLKFMKKESKKRTLSNPAPELASVSVKVDEREERLRRREALKQLNN